MFNIINKGEKKNRYSIDINSIYVHINEPLFSNIKDIKEIIKKTIPNNTNKQLTYENMYKNTNINTQMLVTPPSSNTLKLVTNTNKNNNINAKTNINTNTNTNTNTNKKKGILVIQPPQINNLQTQPPTPQNVSRQKELNSNKLKKVKGGFKKTTLKNKNNESISSSFIRISKNTKKNKKTKKQINKS